MLSKKMTFSLMSLITLLAFAFAVTPAMAAPKGDHPTGLQHDALVTGHAHFGTTLSYDEAENVDGRQVDVTITFGKVVSLASVQAVPITVIVVQDNFESTTYTVVNNEGSDLPGVDGSNDPDNAIIGTPRSTEFGPVEQKDIDLSTALDQYDGVTFTFTIPDDVLLRADLDANPAVLASANKIYVSIPSGIPSLDPADADTSAHQTMAVDLRTVAADQDRDTPAVVSIQRLRPGSQTVVAAFQEAAVTGAFTVRVVLSEAPSDPAGFHGKINVANGIKSGYVIGTPFLRHGGIDANGPDDDANTAADNNAPIPGQTIRPHPIEGRYNHDGVITESLGDGDPTIITAYAPLAGVPEGLDEAHVPLPTGSTGLYWECRITIAPHRRADHVIIKIDEFHDGDVPRHYYYPHQVDKKPNGREQLRLPVAIPAFNLEDGLRVYLPHGDGAQITYANGTAGHYILTRDNVGSHINVSAVGDENAATKQTPSQLLYNVRATAELPNLETFFVNSGIVHLVSYGSHAAGDPPISVK